MQQGFYQIIVGESYVDGDFKDFVVDADKEIPEDQKRGPIAQFNQNGIYRSLKKCYAYNQPPDELEITMLFGQKSIITANFNDQSLPGQTYGISGTGGDPRTRLAIVMGEDLEYPIGYNQDQYGNQAYHGVHIYSNGRIFVNTNTNTNTNESIKEVYKCSFYYQKMGTYISGGEGSSPDNPVVESFSYPYRIRYESWWEPNNDNEYAAHLRIHGVRFPLYIGEMRNVNMDITTGEDLSTVQMPINPYKIMISSIGRKNTQIPFVDPIQPVAVQGLNDTFVHVGAITAIDNNTMEFQNMREDITGAPTVSGFFIYDYPIEDVYDPWL